MLWITLSKYLEPYFILNKKDTVILNKGIVQQEIKIPSHHINKTRFDIYSKDKICQEYIYNGTIKKEFYYNKIDSSSIFYKIYYKNQFKRECNIQIHIYDPYGNMDKFFILYIIPFLVILYIILKLILGKFTHQANTLTKT